MKHKTIVRLAYSKPRLFSLQFIPAFLRHIAWHEKYIVIAATDPPVICRALEQP